MKRTCVLKIDCTNLDKSTFKILEAKNISQYTSVQFQTELETADRFYFNQYFPVSEKLITETFIETYVKNETVKLLLKDHSQKRLDLVAVVGRFALHIFDKTHRTWVCSIEELAY